MLDQFKGFIGYSDDEIQELWANAIFVVDTNVLLNFYKYTSKESTNSLMDILKHLKELDRLWIPHQVAVEYFFNYRNNMYKQQEGYNNLGKKLGELKKSAEKALRNVESEHPYINTDKFKFFIENMEQLNAELQEKMNIEIENLPDSKMIQKDLLMLLDGITGEPYEQNMIDEIEKEGQERYNHNIPPGFEDKDNKEKVYRSFGDIRYQQKYGDLILWNQMIDKANNKDNPVSIIFITEEKKKDWWEIDNHNRIIRPHPQLIQEFFNKTNQNFYMYRTENFVKFVRKYLGAELTDEEFDNVTKDVEQIRRSEDKIDSYDYNNSNESSRLYHKFSINSLLDYLNPNEKNKFNQDLNYVLDDLNSKNFNRTYKNAMIKAINASLPKLEERAKELVTEILKKDYEEAKLFLRDLETLPKDKVKRLEGLLIMINEMENYLYNDGLPF